MHKHMKVAVNSERVIATAKQEEIQWVNANEEIRRQAISQANGLPQTP
jgi:hypothetical protein